MSTATMPKRETTSVTFWPQVDLLPKEVRAGRRLRSLKRVLMVALLAIVLVAALGWVYAFFTLKQAQAEVADVQAETTRLTAEQATYAEVPQVQGQLSRAQEAIVDGTATEVMWADYVEAFRAVTPPAVSYEVMQVTMSSDPAGSVSSDPLQAPSIGQITFTARAETVQDVASWMDAVRGVTGLADPWFSQATVTDAEGYVYYQVSGTVQVTGDSLAHRFGATDDAADDPADTADTATEPQTEGGL